ncbi:MAG: hypothetical protein ACE5I7_19355 [Candidatus Binatia bacterium]
MLRNIGLGRLGLVLGIGLFLCGRASAQPCVGDCNGNGAVTAGELTKVIAVILQCGGVADGCASVSGGCVNADKNGNGTITAGELTNIIFDILTFATGCPATGETPTNTVPPATNTPTRTPTAVPSPTATDTPMPAAAVCGDAIVEAGEDCDDGGTCIGGPNAGTSCTAESDCMGNGVCDIGARIGVSCASDADCPDGRCVHCKTFGGDGCAANCTTETDVPFDFVPGVVVKKCVGGPSDGMDCVNTPQCAPGECLSQISTGTSGGFVHDGILQIPLPVTGSEVLTIGRERDGRIPVIIKAASVKLDKISASILACACVRGLAGKTCGGTVFEPDGKTFSTSCIPGFTAGDSECAGKNPCTFVNGPGNASAGFIGCQSLTGTDADFTQESSMAVPPPPAPTPRPGSGLPILTLSGTGGPGSGIILNTIAIGPVMGRCTDFPTFCTDADPQEIRGIPQTLTLVTGTATATITNTADSIQSDGNIGPFSVMGTPFSCSQLSGQSPSASGVVLAGAFDALNQPTLSDIVVTFLFVAQ